MAKTSVELVDLRLLQRDAGVAGTLKKLMHLRSAFEEPLLDVFGFPFILRHQVFVAGCCVCCSFCCCCGTVPAAPLPSNVLPQDSSCEVDPATDCPSHFSATAAASDTNSTTVSRKVLSSNRAVAVSDSPPYISVSRDCKSLYSLSCTTITATGGGGAGTEGGTYYDFWVPCSLSRCTCCRGYARAFSSKYGSSPSSRSASSSSDSRSTGSRENETSISRIVSRNRKRQRLVGEDPVAAVVAAAVGSHQSSRIARIQDERSVEILLSRNVIRQVKLPIQLGSYVLFFTSDWLQCLQRSIGAAQREALSLLHQQQQCSCVACGGPIFLDDHDAYCTGNSSSSGRNNAESYDTDRHSDSSGNSLLADVEATFCRKCKGSTAEGCYVATLRNSSSSNNNNGIELSATKRRITGSCVSSGKAQSDVCTTVLPRTGGKCCSTLTLRSAEKRAVSNKHDKEEDGGGPSAVPLLRFTPVLRQDEVQPDTGDRGEDYNVADVNNMNSRKKQMLLDLPVRLGEQLKDVLLRQFLNIHTQTHIEKRALEEVLRNYLHAWHQRRHETIIYLRDVLRSSDDLLRKAEENAEYFRRGKTETRLCGEVSEKNTVITNVKTGKTPAACVSASNVNVYPVKRERINAGEYRNEAKEILPKPEQRGSQVPPAKMYARASVKEETVHLWGLLQCGCEAAAEVFTLREHAAADYAGLNVKHEDLPSPEIWTAERQTDEGKAAADNDALYCSVDGLRKREVHERKSQQRRQMWRVKMEEEEADVEETNTGRRPNTLSSSEEQTLKCPGGVRVAKSNTAVNRQAPIAHAPVTLSYLREKIRRATAVMQLLAEGEKALMSTPGTSQTSLLASGESSRVHGQISRLSRATTTRTDGFTPAAVLEKTNLNLAADAFMSRVSVRRSGKAATSPQQRGESLSFTATRTQHREALNARGQKEGSKSDSAKQEHQHSQDVSESRLQQEISGVMILLYDAPFLYSRAGSNTVTLALPQQGLLVRWLQDGRKEALQSIRRKRFKEVLWVDIERRGFHRSGLGSRITLLDLKGIGEVECTETAAGVVVRLAGSADD